jgi:hypothetical protein
VLPCKQYSLRFAVSARGAVTGDLPCGCSLPRAPEGGDGQIEKDRHKNYRSQEAVVIRSMLPTGAGGPNHRRKDDYRQQKKHACDFEPNNAAGPSEGTQETGQALNDTAARLGCGAHFGLDLGPRPGRWRGAGYPFAGNPARNAEPGSHNPANGLRLHCYDANSVPLFSACAQLPIVLFRHRK